MKRFLLILACFLPLLSWADTVTEQRAKEFAKHFLELSKGTRSASVSLQMVYNGIDGPTRAKGEVPPFYVFNNTQGGGFVIVSGDDAVTPILGYSSENNFKNGKIPSNLKYWLDGYATQIKSVRESKIKADAKVAKEWQGMTRANTGNILVVHETAKWGQDSPYNDDCFMINNQHCVTGCVATATAIVMRFNEWPNQGVGTLPAYTFDNGRYSVPSRELNKPYNWGMMPLEGDDIVSPEQKEQVARLMADCGVMVKAFYGLDATGAVTGDVPFALSQYMQYDKSCRFAFRESYTDAQWHRLLQETIQYTPIVYSGSGNAGGHAFVLDGFTDKNFYSTNWGWQGYANGYFVLNALVGGEYEFNTKQGAVLSIKKGDQGGSYAEELRFTEGRSSNKHGLQVNPGTDFTSSFSVNVDGVSNMGSKSTTFMLKMALVNRSGQEKELLANVRLRDMLPGGTASFSISGIRINTTIENGDRIRLFYQTENNPTWRLVEGNDERNIAWEIIVKDEEDENFTKQVNLTYDKETRILELTGLAGGVSVKLTNASGVDFTSQCKTDGMNRCTLNTSLLDAGTYTFTLTKNELGKTKTATLKVVLGDNK